MIILKQAYTQWCDLPGNTVLAAKTRIAAQKVLLDVCAECKKPRQRRNLQRKTLLLIRLKNSGSFFGTFPMS